MTQGGSAITIELRNLFYKKKRNLLFITSTDIVFIVVNQHI